MSASTPSPSLPTDCCLPQLRPTDRDLDRLASAVRTAARDRELPERVADWYEDWIFLFLAWSLKAPPYRIHRDRIGDFWVALTEHPTVPRWKVCQAMDALGVFFGALGGPGALSLPRGGSAEDAPERGTDAPSRSLPDATLPEEVDARAEVPTHPAEVEATGESRPKTEDDAGSGGPPRDRPDPTKTLFNPTGTSSSSEEPPRPKTRNPPPQSRIRAPNSKEGRVVQKAQKTRSPSRFHARRPGGSRTSRRNWTCR